MATPYDNFSFSTPTVDSDEGIARVNANAANTGAFAYKDSQGKTVLTNMAIDATGKESKIGSIGNAPTVPTEGVAAQSPVPTYANTPDVRSSLFVGLDKLRKSTNPGEAAALYDSLVQSLTGEMARMEAEAQNMAQSKYSVPLLQKQIEASRVLDKQSPSYMPGMGDSPVTQRLMVEMRQAGESARAETQQFLRTNMSWNSLDTVKRQADRHFTEIKEAAARATNRTEQAEITRQNYVIAGEAQQANRIEDEARKQKQELLSGYNTLSGTQVRNASILAGNEISGLQEGSEEKKIRIAELTFKNKDKAYVAAISAEAPDEKMALAMQGNTYARTLVKTEESARLGLPIEEVDKMISDMQKKYASFDAKMYLARQPGTQESKAKTKLELDAGTLDISKRPQSEQMRAQLFMQAQQQEVQAKFEGDVGTWRVSDPNLQTMLTASVAKSRQIAGKSDIKNVTAAFLDDGPDDQRLVRANQFVSAMRMASERYQGSAFGQPSYIQSKSAIEREGIANNWWMRAVRAIEAGNRALPTNLLGQQGQANALAYNPIFPAGDVLGRVAAKVPNPFASEPVTLDDTLYQTKK